jgi:hypothetical protein
MERAMGSGASGWLWFVLNVIMPIVLLVALVYGVVQWRNRPRSPGLDRLRDQKVRENYRQEDADNQG